MTTIEEFNKWLKKPEGMNLEFKAASNQFDSEHKLPDYCAAIANQGGGKLILGVDKNGKVVGTKWHETTYNQLSHDLLRKLSLRIDVEELHPTEGRVLIFHIPSRPIGVPLKSNGKYLMRAGESLVEMDEETLKKIFNETQSDFSMQIVSNLTIKDLDEEAILIIKHRWAEKARREDYLQFSTERTLTSLGLLTEKGLNYACLILLGKKEKLDELLACSEIIFEWRQIPQKTSYDYRANWREPFVKVYDEIWKTINARNLRIPFQEGFIQREIWAFDEKSIREAMLNAVAHRDYTINSRSIFIKASPEGFFIESPGGFLPGVTTDNILDISAWRNRRIAEVFEKIGLVERSGQGMNDIFKKTVLDGKGFPNLLKTDNYSVRLEVPAKVKDENFILFLEKVLNEKQVTLSEDEIYALEQIREEHGLPDTQLKNKFLHLGLIEKIGKKRGTQYILSQKYYEHVGKSGTHTKLAGTSREQKKLLILNHLKRFKKGQSSVFQEALDLNQIQVKNLLIELKKDGKVKYAGSKRMGYWILRGE